MGRTLAEVLDLSAAELEVWRQWYEVYGFPDERAEWGRAAAASYVGATMGGKAKPAELVPRVQRVRAPADDAAAVMAWFDAKAKKG